MGMRPVVVASPTLEAVKARIKNEMDQVDEDITKFFDPSSGLHKAKSVRRL